MSTSGEATTVDAALRRAVRFVALAILAYFGIEFAVALAKRHGLSASAAQA